MALRPRTPHRARALLPATRYQSSGPLGALLSSPALDVRLMTALQVLQERGPPCNDTRAAERLIRPRDAHPQAGARPGEVRAPIADWDLDHLREDCAQSTW